MRTNHAELGIQETLTDPAGNITYVNTNKVPLHDHCGNVIGILGTFEDMTERKKAELEVLQAKEVAEAANAAKSHFLSRMSHELRTPLNAILGFAQLLECDRSHPLDPEQKQSINEIVDAGNHLLVLINDILDLSKIETGALAIKIQPVQLNKFISDALSLVNSSAQKQNIMLYPPQAISDDIYVMADAVRLKQAMLNLLNNAIKYNKENGTVTISVESPDEHTIKIFIRDTGLGIDREYQDRVFTPFDRLGADTRAIDGTGIGLVICKQIIELMHGEIGFTSDKDVGTIFWFTLPVVEAVDLAKLYDSVADSKTTALEITAKPGRTILCVEDNEANKRLIESIITSKTPHKIYSVPNAEQAIDMLGNFIPDIIFMDITLPGMNGIEATRLIKQHPDYKDIPILAVSANAMMEDIKHGLNSGFSDYITKPLEITSFLKILSKFLS
jgi:signal transduction histidine kinase/CheY-like chemotaxis protein